MTSDKLDSLLRAAVQHLAESQSAYRLRVVITPNPDSAREELSSAVRNAGAVELMSEPGRVEVDIAAGNVSNLARNNSVQSLRLVRAYTMH